jgi:hypothetical protein
LDCIYVVTVGEIPEVDADGQPVDSGDDPTMHPDHGFALSGVLDILTYPGIVQRNFLCWTLSWITNQFWAMTDHHSESKMTPPHGMAVSPADLYPRLTVVRKPTSLLPTNVCRSA